MQPTALLGGVTIVNTTATRQKAQRWRGSITSSPICICQRPLEPTHRSGAHPGQQNAPIERPLKNSVNTPLAPNRDGRSCVATGDEDDVLLEKMALKLKQRHSPALCIALEECDVRCLAPARCKRIVEPFDVIRSVAARRGQ